MNPLLARTLRGTAARAAARALLGKPGRPLHLGCVFHAEAVHDPAVFARLRAFGAGLPFRPTLCVMTPENPYTAREMAAAGVTPEEFTRLLRELSGAYDIGLHGHWCAPARGVSSRHRAARATRIEASGFAITSSDPAAVESQFSREHAFLSERFGAPEVYSAGWWQLNDTVARLLERFGFGVDCSLRRGRGDSFGERYRPPSAFAPPGRPFRLSPGGSVVEVPSAEYLHLNWWTIARDLAPLLRTADGPLFAVLPLHDYNLVGDGGSAQENLAWLGSLRNVRWLGMREMKDRALDALGGA